MCESHWTEIGTNDILSTQQTVKAAKRLKTD